MTETKAHKAGRAYYNDVGYRDSPLSGEFAGESMREIGDRYGVELADDTDNADDFEAGYWSLAIDDDANNDRMRGGRCECGANEVCS